VLNELRSRPDQELAPETQALLQAVDIGDRRGGWLDHLRALVRWGTA